MARARNIKPSFFTNEDLVELSFETRLLFIGLWTLADRAGRLEDRPKRIKMAVFPADSVDVERSLADLEEAKFIDRYEAEGKLCIQIINFLKHQNPHIKEAPSTLPERKSTDKERGEHGASTVQARCSNSASPADSLIPDSLIPDSLNKEGGKADGEGGDWQSNQPPTAREGEFPMDLSWEPSDHFPTLARQAGAPAPTAEAVAEFRSYWIGQGAAMSQHQWDHKLLTNLKAQKLRGGQAPPGRANARASPGQPRTLSEGRAAAAKAIFNPGPAEADHGHERRTIDVTPAPSAGLGAKALR